MLNNLLHVLCKYIRHFVLIQKFSSSFSTNFTDFISFFRFSAFVIVHAVHNVSVHLEFIKRRRHRQKSISKNNNILSTLHDKVGFLKKRNSCSLIKIIYIRPFFFTFRNDFYCPLINVCLYKAYLENINMELFRFLF